MGDNEARHCILPTVILYIFFLFFAHLWWFGGWRFGAGILDWVVGLVFSVDGVSSLWCGAFWVFCGMTLGKKVMQLWELWMGDASLIYWLSEKGESISLELLSTKSSQTIPPMAQNATDIATRANKLEISLFLFLNFTETIKRFKIKLSRLLYLLL